MPRELYETSPVGNEGGRWYTTTPDNAAVLVKLVKNPKTGTIVAPNVGDARELGLYRGVTFFGKEYHPKENLIRWKCGRVGNRTLGIGYAAGLRTAKREILNLGIAADGLIERLREHYNRLAIPLPKNMDVEAHAEQIVNTAIEDLEGEAFAEYTDLGTKFHAAVAKFFDFGELPPEPPPEPKTPTEAARESDADREARAIYRCVNAIRSWAKKYGIDRNDIACEVPLVCPSLGFGATLDLLAIKADGTLVWADHKTKDFRKFKGRPFTEDALQAVMTLEALRSPDTVFGHPEKHGRFREVMAQGQDPDAWEHYLDRATGEHKPFHWSDPEEWRKVDGGWAGYRQRIRALFRCYRDAAFVTDQYIPPGVVGTVAGEPTPEQMQRMSENDRNTKEA